MPVFSKRANNNNDTSELVNEINDLLNEMRSKAGNSNSQKGGNRKIVSEVNQLLSDIKGVETNLTEDEVFDLAMKGGAKKRKSNKKSKSKSKSKKKSKRKSKSRKQSRSKKAKKSKSKSKSKSKKSKRLSRRSKKSKSKTKSKSSSKSRSRSQKRAEGSKPKRAPNQYIIDLTTLRAYIKNKLPGETLNNVGAMSKAASKILSGNDKDIEKAKKAFKSSSFMRDYKSAEKEINAKRAAKKANKV